MYHQHLTGQQADATPNVVATLKEGTRLENRMDGYVKLDETTLFIGFAETATALGHAVFNTFQSNAIYIHTTREVFA